MRQLDVEKILNLAFGKNDAWVAELAELADRLEALERKEAKNPNPIPAELRL